MSTILKVQYRTVLFASAGGGSDRTDDFREFFKEAGFKDEPLKKVYDHFSPDLDIEWVIQSCMGMIKELAVHPLQYNYRLPYQHLLKSSTRLQLYYVSKEAWK